MQYQITQQVPAQEWEHERARVLERLRARAQHDLEAQNPGSIVTIETFSPSVRPSTTERGAPAASASYIVDVVVDYLVGGQTNPAAS